MLILRRRKDGQNSPGKPHHFRSVTHFDLAFRSLEEIENRSRDILEKKTAVGFLDKTKDSQEVISLVDELRNAIIGFQVGKKHMALPRANTRGTALATTVDAQSDPKSGCKVVGPLLISGLTKYQGFL